MGIFPSAFKDLDPCGFGQILKLFLKKSFRRKPVSTQVWDFMCEKQLLERICLLSEQRVALKLKSQKSCVYQGRPSDPRGLAASADIVNNLSS